MKTSKSLTTETVERGDDFRDARIAELEGALRAFSDWYAALPEPGAVPDSVTLSSHLVFARRVLGTEGGAS